MLGDAVSYIRERSPTGITFPEAVSKGIGKASSYTKEKGLELYRQRKQTEKEGISIPKLSLVQKKSRTPGYFISRLKRGYKFTAKGTGSGYSKESGYPTASYAHAEWKRRQSKKEAV